MAPLHFFKESRSCASALPPALGTQKAYAGKAAVNPELSLTALYRFDRHQSLMLNAGVKSLGKEIKDSPLVDRTTENRVMLGYLYRF